MLESVAKTKVAMKLKTKPNVVIFIWFSIIKEDKKYCAKQIKYDYNYKINFYFYSLNC
jgi:hypothetical protein